MNKKIKEFIQTMKAAWCLFKKDPVAFTISLFIMVIVTYAFYLDKEQLKRGNKE